MPLLSKVEPNKTMENRKQKGIAMATRESRSPVNFLSGNSVLDETNRRLLDALGADPRATAAELFREELAVHVTALLMPETEASGRLWFAPGHDWWIRRCRQLETSLQRRAGRPATLGRV
jgi:hypothetical protein